jgi:gamma-glutamyl-gamma-aminobutyrate hydrolase PuuD
VGKSGNKARREAKRRREAERHATLDENIQMVLREDDQQSSLLVDTTSPEYKTAFEKIYGKPGPPNDNVVFLGFPPSPPKKKVVDCLGRVVEIDYKIPEVLRATMPQKTPKHDPVDTQSEQSRRRVMICRDHALDYPELWMEVFVEPDPDVRDDEARFAQMFARSRCSRAKSVLESDLVVFGGGSDVDPALYGEERHETTLFDSSRDDRDIMLYNMCVEHGIPMMGICRGAQFLHVMNGGKLYQDVNNHIGNHKIWDLKRKEWIDKVSSVHHQMCVPNKEGGMEILATNGQATQRWLNPKHSVVGTRADVEAFFYRDTCCIGVQGHPEYSGYNYFTKWCLELVNELVLCSPDIEWRDGQRRVKLELLEERKHIAPQKQPKARAKKGNK